LYSNAQQVFPGGGSGSYNLSYPSGPYVFPNTPPPTTPPSVSHYQLPGDDATRSGTTNPSLRNPANRMSPGYTGPFPTHKFWTPVIWNYNDLSQIDYTSIMYAQPLAFGVQNTGFSIMYEYSPQINVTDYFYEQQYRHLGIALSGMSLPATSGVTLKSYGDWSATIEWNDGAGRTLEATVSRGSPYVFCKKSGANVLYNCLSSGCTISATSLTDPYADAYMIEMFFPAALGNKYYGIFVPKGTTLVGNEFIFPAGQDYFSVAALPDNKLTTLNTFASHAFAFITDTKVSWVYDNASSKVNSTYDFTIQPQGLTTESNTLIALYRHQWKNTSLPFTSYSYQSARGEMKVYEGKSFTTSITNHGVIPSMPDAGNYDYTRLDNYLSVYNAAPPLPANVGPYTGGLAMSRYCGLIDIAHQRGNYTLRDALRTRVKEYLENWFSAPDGKSDELFYYDANWTVLLAYPSAFESDRQMNDQHFHYGYFIKAAATIAQYEPDYTWVNKWGPMVEMLIKNCANWDRSDHRFPFLRFHDAYEGHAWASGFSGGLKGNNQESGSEALNFTSAVMLWGINTGNTTIRDLGIFLHTTEVEATRQYWFDEDNIVFPAAYDRTVAGQVWGYGVEYRTWFGPGGVPSWNGVFPQEVHGIQLIPMTGGHLYLGLNPTYAADNYAEMVANNGGPETRWLETFWMYQSFFDPAAASVKFDANEASYAPKDGESKAHTYHWIHNLDSMGTIDGSVTADVPTYSVFTKDDCKHYVIYNPPGFAQGNPYAAAKTVHFSDGQSFFVPEDTLIVFKHCTDALPVQLISFNASNYQDQFALLEWTTASEINTDYFEVQRSAEGFNWQSIGKVAAAGNSNSFLNYSYMDKNPNTGVNYYRIREVDFNKNDQFTDVKTVAFHFENTIKVIIDNPDKTIEIYVHQVGKAGEVNVVIYDVLGKVMVNESKTLKEGMNKIRFQATRFSPGMYILKINSGNVHIEKAVVSESN